MTTDPAVRETDMRTEHAVTELLLARDAATIPHAGGTLLDHLHRVHALLDIWGARAELRLAGLCHAYYGTDGFGVTLGRTDRRDELAAVIGAEAEDIVYAYASCDRTRTYPALAAGVLTDRFTGRQVRLTERRRADLAELTVANELDVLNSAEVLDAATFAPLLDRFVTWRPLLSPAAYRAVEQAR